MGLNVKSNLHDVSDTGGFSGRVRNCGLQDGGAGHLAGRRSSAAPGSAELRESALQVILQEHLVRHHSQLAASSVFAAVFGVAVGCRCCCFFAGSGTLVRTGGFGLGWGLSGGPVWGGNYCFWVE